MNASLKLMIGSTPLLLCALVAAMADVTTQSATQQAVPTTASTRSAMSSSTKPTTQPVSVAPARPPRDYYEPLVRKNIFLKVPGQSGLFSTPYTPLPPQATTAPTTRPSLASSWVLTGTALGIGSPAALLENSDSGEVLRVKPGDSTVVGRITSIDADGINIQTRTGISRVLVGSSLDGNATPATLPAASTQSDATSGGGPSEDSILERLRRRRLKEMGK